MKLLENLGKGTLDGKEEQLVSKIERGFESMEGIAFGVTYIERQINAETHVRFNRKDAFEDVFDFDAIADKQFEPTIGLPAENLLFSLSTQGAIFRSPGVARALLKSVVPSFGRFFGRQSG